METVVDGDNNSTGKVEIEYMNAANGELEIKRKIFDRDNQFVSYKVKRFDEYENLLFDGDYLADDDEMIRTVEYTYVCQN